MNNVTIDTYDCAAKEYADKFAGVGARTDLIETTFLNFNKDNPVVLELGCGDGRDAVEICKRTKEYAGIDLSKEMIALAKKRNLDGNFAVADMEEYEFGKVDLVFAFASLLHVDKEALGLILKKARLAMSSGGLFCIEVKEGGYQGPQLVSDQYGDRTFYFYQEKDIRDLAIGYEVMDVKQKKNGRNVWLGVVLRKV